MTWSVLLLADYRPFSLILRLYLPAKAPRGTPPHPPSPSPRPQRLTSNYICNTSNTLQNAKKCLKHPKNKRPNPSIVIWYGPVILKVKTPHLALHQHIGDASYLHLFRLAVELKTGTRCPMRSAKDRKGNYWVLTEGLDSTTCLLQLYGFFDFIFAIYAGRLIKCLTHLGMLFRLLKTFASRMGRFSDVAREVVSVRHFVKRPA